MSEAACSPSQSRTVEAGGVAMGRCVDRSGDKGERMYEFGALYADIDV